MGCCVMIHGCDFLGIKQGRNSSEGLMCVCVCVYHVLSTVTVFECVGRGNGKVWRKRWGLRSLRQMIKIIKRCLLHTYTHMHEEARTEKLPCSSFTLTHTSSLKSVSRQ